jgi:hypothetical protein
MLLMPGCKADKHRVMLNRGGFRLPMSASYIIRGALVFYVLKGIIKIL